MARESVSKNYGVEVIFEYFRFAEKHRGPVTGVDELDACISGAGKIVGDYSYQHVSTLQANASACQHISLSCLVVGDTSQ